MALVMDKAGKKTNGRIMKSAFIILLFFAVPATIAVVAVKRYGEGYTFFVPIAFVLSWALFVFYYKHLRKSVSSSVLKSASELKSISLSKPADIESLDSESPDSKSSESNLEVDGR